VFTIVGMVFAARQSGIAFDDALEGSIDVSRHEDLANGTLILTLLWFAASVVTVAFDRRAGRLSAPATATGDPDRRQGTAFQDAGAAITAGFAVLATIWLIRTGHEGADLVWRQTSERIFG
jgi:hypothetical protein